MRNNKWIEVNHRSDCDFEGITGIGTTLADESWDFPLRSVAERGVGSVGKGAKLLKEEEDEDFEKDCACVSVYRSAHRFCSDGRSW
jgi:hypothetical protein